MLGSATYKRSKDHSKNMFVPLSLGTFREQISEIGPLMVISSDPTPLEEGKTSNLFFSKHIYNTENGIKNVAKEKKNCGINNVAIKNIDVDQIIFTILESI